MENVSLGLVVGLGILWGIWTLLLWTGLRGMRDEKLAKHESDLARPSDDREGWIPTHLESQRPWPCECERAPLPGEKCSLDRDTDGADWVQP